MPVTNEISLVLPAVDSVPLMGHPILQKVLMLLTFVLHVIPMNLVLGGLTLALVLKAQKTFKIGGFEMAGRLYSDIVKMLPTALSFTITLGVAPLLFIQALYGPLFYTTTILMAPFWLSILAIIVVNYYALYFLSWTGEKTAGPLRLPVAALVLAGFLFIAFILSSNNSFMQAPHKFMQIHRTSSYGLYLYANDLNLWVRYAHVFFGSIFVASIITFAVAWYRRAEDEKYSEYIILWSRRAFLLSFLAQAALGFYMLYIQKPHIYAAFMGGSVFRTAVFWGAVAVNLAIAGLGHMSPKKLAAGGSQAFIGLLAFVALAGMAINRDFIRDAEIGAAFNYLDNPYQWNFVVIGAFLLILLGGLATVYYMLTLPSKEQAPAK